MKRKGFTLIELIAVVVVLSILAVITVPIILNQINETKKETYRASVRTLFDSVSSYLASHDVTGYLSTSGIIVNDSIYKNLDLKNDIFTGGRIYLDNNQVLHAEMISDGYFCANGTKGELTIVKGDCAYLDETAPEVSLYVNRVTSNSITVVVNSIDDDSGIKSYTYYLNGAEVTTIKDNMYTFKNLKSNTKYEIMVKAVNGNDLESTDTVSATTNTNDFVWKETPKGWSYSKTVTIIYPSVGGETYQYQIVGETDWVTINSNTVDIFIEKDATIVARIMKQDKVVDFSSKTFGGIDKAAPIIQEIVGNDKKWTTSKRITIKAVDKESGLADEPYSFDGGKTWQASPSKTFAENQVAYIWVRDKTNNIVKASDDNGSVYIEYIDPTIPLAHNMTATTTDGNVYKSGSWTNQTVILKANPNPESTLSGYTYQWYIKENNNYVVIPNENKSTLEIPFRSGVYKVEILTNAGGGPTASSNAYEVKIDKNPPTCEWSGENKTWTTATQKISAKCVDETGGSGCSVQKQWTFDETTKTADLTYKVSDGAGNKATCKKAVNVYVDKTGPSITVKKTTASTRKIGINYTSTDAHSGVDSKSYSCKLGTTEGKYNIDCSSDKLSHNTKYYYQITVSDKLGNVGTAKGTVTTRNLSNITFDVTDSSTWTKTKKVTINADKVEGITLQYRVKDYLTDSVITDWTEITPGTTIPTITTKVKVYAEITDGYNTYNAPTLSITKIDVTAPKISTIKSSATTSSITLKYTVADTESGVASNKCCYKASKAVATPGLSSDEMICVDATSTGCTMPGLKNNTNYEYVIKASDVVGNDISKKGSMTTNEFSTCSLENLTGSGWARSKKVKVVGVTSGSTLQYKVGTSGNWTAISSGSTVDITKNETVYCRLWDGSNSSSTSSIIISKIDRTAPVLTLIKNSSEGKWVNTDVQVNFLVNETDSGIDYCQYLYEYDSNNNKCGKTGSSENWCKHTTNNSGAVYFTTHSAERNTTVYKRCYDKAGNVSNVISTPIKIDKTAPKVVYDYSHVKNVCTKSGNAYKCTGTTSPKIHSTCTDSGGSGVASFEHYDEQWGLDHKENNNGNRLSITICSPNDTINYSVSARHSISKCYDNAGNIATDSSGNQEIKSVDIIRTRTCQTYNCSGCTNPEDKNKCPEPHGDAVLKLPSECFAPGGSNPGPGSSGNDSSGVGGYVPDNPTSGQIISSGDLDSGNWISFTRYYSYDAHKISTNGNITKKTCYQHDSVLEYAQTCQLISNSDVCRHVPESNNGTCYRCTMRTRMDLKKSCAELKGAYPYSVNLVWSTSTANDRFCFLEEGNIGSGAVSSFQDAWRTYEEGTYICIGNKLMYIDSVMTREQQCISAGPTINDRFFECMLATPTYVSVEQKTVESCENLCLKYPDKVKCK